MYYTEKEIMTQHEAVRRTFEYFEGKKKDVVLVICWQSQDRSYSVSMKIQPR